MNRVSPISLAIAFLLLLTTFAPVGLAAGGPGTPFSNSPNVSNLPPGCQRSFGAGLNDGCYHMRGELNALDSPKIDVLLVVPPSPYAERDLRAMEQVIHMFDDGVDYIADQEGLEWLAEGVEFHVTPMVWDPTAENGGEFTTYPVVDPEIVVFRGNPFFVPIGLSAILGIGIDPLAGILEGPCHNIQNPFDIAEWEMLPGFDSHHDGRSGTYKEDCNGAGGNICFAVNGGAELLPGFDLFGINAYDLIAHEVGHCLRLGHVGDAGTEFSAAAAPLADIMSYTEQTFRKCVSSLDVEQFAVAMSPYLDVNGDGAVTAADRLYNNDHLGDGSAFQVQRPEDHYYASETGLAKDCPQPDLSLTPFAMNRDYYPGDPGGGGGDTTPVVAITSPAAGSTVPAGPSTVTGTTEFVQAAGELAANAGGPYSGAVGEAIAIAGSGANGARPYSCAWSGAGATFADAAACGTTVTFATAGDKAITLTVTDAAGAVASDGATATVVPAGAANCVSEPDTDPASPWDITKLCLSVDAGELKGVLHLGDPSAIQATSCSEAPATWGFWIDGFADGPVEVYCLLGAGVSNWAGGSAFDTAGTATFDADAGTFTVRIPATEFAGLGSAPTGHAESWNGPGAYGGRPMWLTGSIVGQEVYVDRVPDASLPSASTTVVEFEHPDGNLFWTEQSTAGVTPILGVDASHFFTLQLAQASDVTVRLEWTGETGLSDLDLYVTGAADSGTDGASSLSTWEEVTLLEVPAGTLTLQVEPFMVLDPVFGTSYTLTAEVTGEGPADSDGDGVPDGDDACPGTAPGEPVDASGCPLTEPGGERVDLYVGGDLVGSTATSTGAGSTPWSVRAELAPYAGQEITLEARWYDGDELLASRGVAVTVDGETEPARMTITSPQDGAAVSGIATVQGTVTPAGASAAGATLGGEMPVPAIAFVAAEDVVDLSGTSAREGPPVPAPSDGLGPGSPILTYANGVVGICTANYVWKDQAGDYYIGAAGHCFFVGSDETKTATHGPGADMPGTGHIAVRACIRMCATGGANLLADAATGIGVSEFVGDLVDLGGVAYARQGPQVYGQDFGLVRIPEALEPLIRPEMPVWNGPLGPWTPPTTDAEILGNPVFVYGNSVGFGETFATKARAGTWSFEPAAYPGAWVADLPAAQGDSGSAVNFGARTGTGNVVESRDAMGILTHLFGHPTTAGTTVQKAIAMATEAGLAIDFLREGESAGGGGGGTGDPVPETWYAHQTACRTGQRMDTTDSAGDFEHPCFPLGISGEATLGLIGSFPSSVATRGANAGDDVSSRVYIYYDETPASVSTVTAVLKAGGLEVGRGSAQRIIDPLTWSGFGFNAYDISFELTGGYAPGTALRWEVFHQGSARAELGYEGSHASWLRVGSTIVVNAPPEVEAGAPQSVIEGRTVSLSGSCADPDGHVVGCAWSQVSGPSVALTDAGDGTAAFTAPLVASDAAIVLRLTGTDDDGAASSDDVTVTVLDIQSRDHVQLLVDGDVAAAVLIAADDSWSSPVDFSGYGGAVTLEARWVDPSGAVVASQAIALDVLTDADGDGVLSDSDNCVDVPNADQSDVDGDGVGDACDPQDDRDLDADGVLGGSDNCPTVANPGQEDLDADGVGDACDGDVDGDGVANAADAFPRDASEWSDGDSDGVGDNSDRCAGHPDAADMDGDGTADGCDADMDGDGYSNAQESGQGTDPANPASRPNNPWTSEECAAWKARNPANAPGPPQCRFD